MKTLEHCKNKIAKRYGYQDFYSLLREYKFNGAYMPLHEAAELYGRYCRFVGYCQGKQKLKL